MVNLNDTILDIAGQSEKNLFLDRVEAGGSEGSTGSSFLDARIVQTGSVLKAYNDEQKLEQASLMFEQDSNTVGVQATSSAEVDKFVTDEANGVVEVAATNPMIADDEGIEGVANYMKELEAIKTSPTGLTESIIIAYNPEIPLSIAKAMAVREEGAALMAANFDTKGFFGDVADFMGLVLPANFTLTVDALKDTPFGEKFDFDSVFELNEIWDSIPPEVKEENMGLLIESIKEVSDNEFHQREILENILGTSESADWSVGLDGVDVALTLAWPVSKLVKFLSFPRTAQRLAGNEAAAAAIANLADGQGRSLKQLGTTTDEIQASVTPTPMEDFFVGVTDEIKADVAKEFDVKMSTIEAEAANIRSSKEGVLVDDDISAIRNKVEAKYNDRMDIENITIKEKGGEVTAVIREKNGDVIEQEVVLTRDDLTGGFNGKIAFGELKSSTLTPSTLFKNLKENVVDKMTLLREFLPQANMRTFQKIGQEAFRGVDNEGIKKIDSILLAGDSNSNQRIFSLVELMDEGVETSLGRVKLNSKEAAAYYSSRAVFDQLWDFKNAALRREIEFEGYKSINLTERGLKTAYDEISEQALIKEVDSVPVSVARLFNAIDGSEVSLASARKMVEEGQGKLYQVRDNIRGRKTGEDANLEYKYVFASDDLTSNVPANVLRYNSGYVPRLNKDVFFVAKGTTLKVINGVETRVPYTHSMFARRDEAKRYVDEQNALTDVPEDKLTWQPVNDLPNAEVQKLENESFGGVYTGARSSRDIKFGYNQTTPARESAVNSMQRMMGHVSSVASINEFKLQIINKFRNTYREVMENPDDWKSPLKSTADPDIITQYNKMQDWLGTNLGLQTAEQTKGAVFMNSLANGLEKLSTGKDFGRLSSWAHTQLLTHSTDPWALGRTLTFNTFLGFWNPAQLVVQASGAAIAFSINPQRFGKSMQQYLAMRSANMIMDAGNEAGLRAFAKKHYKVAGFDSADEYFDMTSNLYKTGVWQSLRANSDYAALSQGMTFEPSRLQSFWDSRLMFFREGEGFNRLYGLSNAYQDWRKANPTAKFTQDVADQVAKDSLKYTLNLTSANKAAWQNGWTSIPTQFMQITAKFAEAITGNKLTQGQKAKMLTGQVALFGAAGVPFLPAGWVPSIVESLGGDPSQIDDRYSAAVAGGITSFLSNEVIGNGGLDPSRFSLQSSIEGTIKTFFDGDATAWEALLGAFSSIPSKAYQTIGYGMAMMPSAVADLDGGRMLQAVSQALEFTSTWDNAMKVTAMANLGKAVDSRGRPLMDADIGVMVARGFGMTTLEEATLYKNNQIMYKESRRMNDATNAVTEYLSKYWSVQHSAAEVSKLRDSAAVLMVMTGITDPKEQQKVWLDATKKLGLGRDRKTDLNQKVIRHYLSGGGENFSIGVPTGPRPKENNDE